MKSEDLMHEITDFIATNKFDNFFHIFDPTLFSPKDSAPNSTWDTYLHID